MALSLEPHSFRRHGSVLTRLFVAVLLVVGLLALLPIIRSQLADRKQPLRCVGEYTPLPLTFQGESTDLQQTAVVPTLDTPIPPGKNAIWCASFELAWGCLAQDVLRAPPELDTDAGIAGCLNRAVLRGVNLPRESCLALAGFARDGIVDAVRLQMRQRFGKEISIRDLEPQDILAYAYLEANAAFTLPFFDAQKPIRFMVGDATTEVNAFGIEQRHEYAYDRLRARVEVLYVGSQNPWKPPDEFVIDPCRDSSPNQVQIARVSRRATLGAILEDVEAKACRSATAGESRRFGVRDVFLVPSLHFAINHNYTELSGKPLHNPGFTEYRIGLAQQRIQFRLDRGGAELASEAQIICKPSATYFVCDGPFVIVMRQRGAPRPFFVMWVENAELLAKCRPALPRTP